MSHQQTTVLITGANRGDRRNHTVIAAVRNVDGTTLREYKPAEGSKLIVVKIENTSRSDAADAVEQVIKEGITSLDIVIANAGINPLDALLEVKDMDVEQLHHLFDVNTFSFVSLFKAVHPLLKATADSQGRGAPKLVAISSYTGQIVDMEATIPARVGSYGVSKLGLNYLVRRAHFENPWLTAWVNDPGFAQTDNGNATARLFGMPEAPVTLEQSVVGLQARIDAATRSGTSGRFYNFDGAEFTF
ncbi:Nor-1 [Ophiocordyceps sinensis CO18]|uniref:Nor-1 n=1 Tax=Ophiocordyceps sinensis (strain Co18 / CGMCC 3.14243) TaxID=911162 RepID=T5AFX3_OPHSC|nr:Nor-1 [Ophiocordyceps sinensis CO18]